MPKALEMFVPTRRRRTPRRPACGAVRWDGEVWRRWSGHRWSTAAYSLHPERLEDPAPLDSRPEAGPAARQRALQLAVEDQVATNGADVAFEGPSGVVLSYRRRDDRVRLEVDAWGNVWAVRVASAP